MRNKVILTIFFNVLLREAVYALRISPKLDFGDPSAEKLALSAGIRPSLYTKTNYRTEDAERKTDAVTVSCGSGGCKTTNAKIQTDHGISTDVLVHVKTNVDTEKIKNETSTVAPDVPVVVGTKTSTVSTITNNRPQFPLLSSSINPNYPNAIVRGDSQIRGSYEYNNYYAPKFQDRGNGVELQSGYPQPTINFGNNDPVTSSTTWYPRQSGLGGYNPVEFRKTYRNTWNPMKWYGSNTPNNSERRVAGGIPRWSPSCVCPRPDGHYNPATLQYGQSTYPLGINDKLASLH